MKALFLIVVVVVGLLISACMPIHAMPAIAPQEAQAPQVLFTADVLRGVYSAPAALAAPVAGVEAAPLLLTSDVLRGVYDAPPAPQLGAEVESEQFISTSDVLRDMVLTRIR